MVETLEEPSREFVGSDTQLTSRPSAGETNSKWVANEEWPYPFVRFGEYDPFSPKQEKILETSTLEYDRVKKAEEVLPEWDREIITKGHPQPSDVEVDESDTTESSSVDESNNVSLASHAASLATPERIISSSNDYELHENVAHDLVDYIRSDTIRNEDVFVLLAFAYVSGLLAEPGDYISSVSTGTSSSGKSHLKDKIDELLEHLDVMDMSTGTNKSLHHDDDWEDADVISMGELQQPSDEMLEFLKRAHGGDKEVVIRQTRGNPSEGFHTEKVTKDAKSYHCTYAQFDADFEFWNRLLKLPVHESESKNRAVGRMKFGHGDIDIGEDVEYGYDFEDGMERLQAHMLELKRNAPKQVVMPNGGGDFDLDVWDVVKTIFNHSRSESNRVYGMVDSLIKSSAMVNFHSRETMEWTVRTEDGTEQKEALVAEAQDVANVLRCLDVLRATTHEIDQRKRAVVEAIKTKGDPETDSVEGVEPIIQYLEESDASKVNKPELENILGDLEDNYLITVDGDTITANNWDALGEPRIDENRHHFEGTTDPIGDQPFLDWWDDRRDGMETRGSDLMDPNSIESSGRSIADDEEVREYLAQIDEPDIENWKLRVLREVRHSLHGVRVPDMRDLTIEGFLGFVEPSRTDVSNVETKGSILDPDHDIWDVDDKADTWVTTETDARRHIQQTIQELMERELIDVDEVHESVNGKPVEVTLDIEGGA